MKRRLALLFLLAALTVPAAARPAAEAPADDGAPRLRRWHVGLQLIGTRRSRYDVFRVADLPAGEVREEGAGLGLYVGRRFGDRFLLDLRLTASGHEVADGNQSDAGQDIIDFEALVTGTVLFRERHTLQPFLRGGFGAGGESLTLQDDPGHLLAIGTAAQAGAGAHVRLGGRVSLEIEATAVFTNFLEVFDESDGDLWPDESWQVRTSSWGWRSGVGLVFWF